ncbi:MAG: hypothetical protein AAF806_28260 [Bacteroidota bacterium]
MIFFDTKTQEEKIQFLKLLPSLNARIQATVQTQDGVIWLGTSKGLLRIE